MTKSPQQQAPNLEIASLTCTDIVIHPEYLPYHLNPIHFNKSFGIVLRTLAKRKQIVPEQTVTKQVFSDQPSETNTLFAEPEISTNDQPSSSNLAIQTCAPARTTNVPSPPTLFLDSTILADVCENILQELNKLIGARNNLVHEESYEKQWRRLRERVEFVLSEL